jgi:DNA-binding protein HU-beta
MTIHRKERTPMADTKNYGKTSLIDDITAATTGYSRKAIAEIVDAALDTIQAKVAAGQAVTLTGFGTFRQTQRSARTGTNVRTGQKIHIPAQASVRFTAGSELKTAVKGKARERGR